MEVVTEVAEKPAKKKSTAKPKPSAEKETKKE
jgi:hypothetical protein